MFERRLKLLLICLAAPTVLLVLRLVQLQVVRAGQYEYEAERMLIKPVRLFPFLRGSITDRQGRRLAYDAESWDICVHYGILSGDRDYLRALARSRLEAQSVPLTRANVAREVEHLQVLIEPSWQAIAELTGTPLAELQKVGAATVRRVQQIKKNVSDDRGIETVVLEERTVHPVARGLDQATQVAARVRLADYPWVEVAASHIRKYAGGEPVGPFLGLLREVDDAMIAPDAASPDDLARYRPGDTFGFCGVEALAEPWVRGRRGREQENTDGQTITITPPVNGKDFRLTIDLPLQRALYDRLASAVHRYAYSTGGAAVVLDIPSRQVLAMVSYPSFDPGVSWQGRQLLAQDQLGQPTSCRAIAGGCLGRCPPPGSIVKPMILVGALTDGKLGPTEQITCRGHLFADYPDRWRCTATWGHGPVGPVYSIQHSCNVFYYVVGERMGVERLAHRMSQFGLGRPTGTGLREEERGNLPTHGGAGNARHMGIGQWELEVTPMQAANLAATIASGRYRPVTLWANDPEPRPATPLDVPEPYWRILRQGMYDAVNEQGGTAYEHAHLTDAGDHVLLGKTGSATAPPQEFLYTCRFEDGHTEVIRARNRNDLLAQRPADATMEIIGQTPAAEYPTHAWFIGYLAPRNRYLEPATSANGGHLSVAIAVLIEYAGHGGEVAAPIACDMLRDVLDRQHGELAGIAPHERTDAAPGPWADPEPRASARAAPPQPQRRRIARAEPETPAEAPR